MQSDRRRVAWFALGILIAILAILYLRGFFDAELYRFGVNHYPCTHDLSGHIACGPGIAGTPYGLRPGSGLPVVVLQRGAA